MVERSRKVPSDPWHSNECTRSVITMTAFAPGSPSSPVSLSTTVASGTIAKMITATRLCLPRSIRINSRWPWNNGPSGVSSQGNREILRLSEITVGADSGLVSDLSLSAPTGSTQIRDEIYWTKRIQHFWVTDGYLHNGSPRSVFSINSFDDSTVNIRLRGT
jgi:hypothetical protein